MRGVWIWASGREEDGYGAKVHIEWDNPSLLGSLSTGVQAANLSTPGHENFLICGNWQPDSCLPPTPARILA